MNNDIKIICDYTIKNYRLMMRYLRFDGEYINHFSALINGYNKNDTISVEKIREIRTYFRENTSNMSSFRGDILYILSFLIMIEGDDYLKTCDSVMEVFNMLLDEGFDDCDYLVLAAHSVVRYSDEKSYGYIIKKSRLIFEVMKEQYSNFTKSDDYLLCVLLAINDLNIQSIIEDTNDIFAYFRGLNIFSNNGLQSLSNSIVLNNNKNSMYALGELLGELNNNDIKIGIQFLQILGAIYPEVCENDIEYSIKEVLDYLSSRESGYDFYIDKDFRTMISIIILFSRNNGKSIKYIDELLASSIYSFLNSKNQGIINEVLA